ncbi:MAG TPA: 3-hydroxyacyl-CoA dehydrogenase family protein [Stellaceae bacterium]|nr:3-hydroxyacyl-CoA dehydrogenase family protein [Stellaceae bacterium]
MASQTPIGKGKVGVVGAGLMGAEIALVYALAGYGVRLADRTSAELDAAMQRLSTILEKGVGRGFYRPEETGPALRRIETTTDLATFGDRDMVTEAVFEEESVKAEIFRRLDAILPPHTLIASNTSSIAISTLAAHVSPPRRPLFLGTHYFSPVSRMRLVEVIPQFETSETAVERAMAYCRDAGKTPIRVKDVVGFAVNRVLHAFVIEAIKLVEEGVATPEDIDLACKLGLGHPIGPFELMDVTTSKLCLQVQEILHEAYGERFRPPALLKQRVNAGYLGRKVGKGWLKTPDKRK